MELSLTSLSSHDHEDLFNTRHGDVMIFADHGLVYCRYTERGAVGRIRWRENMRKNRSLYLKPSLILCWLLLTILASGCQSSRINQSVYAAISDTSDLYFSPTMQQVLRKDQNAIYAASFPLAWQAVRKELNLLDDIHTKSADLRMLDGSEIVESTLDEDDYERDITRRGQFLHVKTRQEVSLSFIPSFEDFPQGLPFDDIIVNAFGTRGFQNPAYINQLHIAAYRDDNRFILRLTPPQQEHELFLFKADSAYSTFHQM